MIILLDNKIIDKTGTLFALETSPSFAPRVRAIQADSVINCADMQEATACLAGLAERLGATGWDSNARCFIPARWNPDTVERIIYYMSQDTYPESYVDDGKRIVAVLEW